MKKALFFLAFAVIGISSFSQILHKGNLIGVHVYAPDLRPGVTMEEFTKFLTSKWIPDINKTMQGAKVYLMKSLRGQDSSSLGLIFIFDSEAARNKYWNKDGTPNELYTKTILPLTKEVDKYVTSSYAPTKYNDWIVK